MKLRVLYPDHDEHLYRVAWAWRLTYPRLVRRWDALTHFRQWYALMRRRVSVGIFTDKLVALVTLRPDGNGVYECHFDCERRIDMDVLLVALMSIERVVFEEWQAREVFAAIISRNCAILRVAEACGFQRDGIEERIGNLRWVRLRKTASEYNQNSKGHFNQHSDVRETTRRVECGY